MTDQPRQLLADDGAEYLALCARANRPDHRGDYDILSVKIGPANAQYTLTVRWNQPKQQELIP